MGQSHKEFGCGQQATQEGSESQMRSDWYILAISVIECPSGRRDDGSDGGCGTFDIRSHQCRSSSQNVSIAGSDLVTWHTGQLVDIKDQMQRFFIC